MTIKNYLSRLVSALFVFLCSLTIDGPANAAEITILYTGDAIGVIEPCG